VHCINPCFRHSFDPSSITGPDWQQLADDLAAALVAWTLAPTAHQLTVKLYEITAPSGTPNRPKATKVLYPNQAGGSTYPGELALCLSFYGGSNAPSQRGRLYLPIWSVTNSTPGERPSSTERAKAGALVTPLAALGGANVDWGVWSGKNGSFTKSSNWYVDDEWDTQRRRGLRPTTRTSGSTSG